MVLKPYQAINAVFCRESQAPLCVCVPRRAGRGRWSTRCTACHMVCSPVDRRNTSCNSRNGSRPSPGWNVNDVSLLEPRWGGELARPQEFGVKELGLVAGAGIGEDRHDRVAGAELARETHGAAHIDPGRAAEYEPLILNEAE